MNKREICVKVLAVMLTVCAVVCASGREMLINAFAENKKADFVNLGKSRINNKNEQNKAKTKIDEMIKKSVLSRAKDEDPFLVKDIKYSVTELENYICLSNSNQRWVYSKRANVCIYFSYDCSIGDTKYSSSQCRNIAKEAVRQVLSDKEYGNEAEIKDELQTEKISTFFFSVPSVSEKNISVSVRRDTGSIILFDAGCLDVADKKAP